MTEVNFGSTFRIPVTQAGVNKAKKAKLKELTMEFNGLVGNSNLGYARVSMNDKLDNTFIAKLKRIGYIVYQKFSGESIPNNELDSYIKECLKNKEFNQYGKFKK